MDYRKAKAKFTPIKELAYELDKENTPPWYDSPKENTPPWYDSPELYQ